MSGNNVCNNRYDVQKILPCVCSIGSKCESNKIVVKKNNTSKILCPICNQVISLTCNQLNKLVQKCLLKAPRKAQRSDLYEDASNKVNEIKSIQEKFNEEIIDS